MLLFTPSVAHHNEVLVFNLFRGVGDIVHQPIHVSCTHTRMHARLLDSCGGRGSDLPLRKMLWFSCQECCDLPASSCHSAFRLHRSF